MQSDPRSAGKRLREFMVVAPAAALLMTACGGLDGVDLTASLRSEGAGVGTGVADIEISSDRTRLCWDIRGLVGTDGVTGMHIHVGPAGVVGAVVVEFRSGNRGCHDVSPAGGVSEAALRDIADDPASFYVDVHGGGYPDGSIRGQLEPTGDGK